MLNGIRFFFNLSRRRYVTKSTTTGLQEVVYNSVLLPTYIEQLPFGVFS